MGYGQEGGGNIADVYDKNCGCVVDGREMWGTCDTGIFANAEKTNPQLADYRLRVL